MGKKAIIAAVLIHLAFVGGRSVINASHSDMIPCAQDAECAAAMRAEASSPAELEADLRSPIFNIHAWLRRDLAKTPLRLAVLAACLLAAWRLGGLARWGWHGRLPAAAAGMLALTFAHHAGKAVGATPSGYSPGENIAGVLGCIPVGLWEEACYRGILYLGLRESTTPLRAAALSSLLFMLMHWGAMPVQTWGYLFVTGYALCAAMELGAGLPWIALAHGAIDAMWIFAMGGPGPYYLLGLWLCRVFALAALAFSWRALKTAGLTADDRTRPGQQFPETVA